MLSISVTLQSAMEKRQKTVALRYLTIQAITENHKNSITIQFRGSKPEYEAE